MGGKSIRAAKLIQLQREITQEFRAGVFLKLKHYQASASCSMSPFTDKSNIHRN